MIHMILMLASGFLGATVAGFILFVTTKHQSPFEARSDWYTSELPVVLLVMVSGLMVGMLVAYLSILLARVFEKPRV